jgi:HEPN domain-containing protein
MVVSAFASELYFKILIAIDGKRPPRSHDLLDLFLELPRECRGIWKVDGTQLCEIVKSS